MRKRPAYKFIGQHLSMGLMHGDIYELEHVQGIVNSVLRIRAHSRSRGVVEIPYSSVHTFTDNWERVK